MCVFIENDVNMCIYIYRVPVKKIVIMIVKIIHIARIKQMTTTTVMITIILRQETNGKQKRSNMR